MTTRKKRTKRSREVSDVERSITEEVAKSVARFAQQAKTPMTWGMVERAIQETLRTVLDMESDAERMLGLGKHEDSHVPSHVPRVLCMVEVNGGNVELRARIDHSRVVQRSKPATVVDIASRRKKP